jgi:predicted transcriptional regulator
VGKRAHTDLDVRGDLQIEFMNAIWRLEEATVDGVRETQPAGRRSAYTTVQTVLNRLVERGLLVRERSGRAFVRAHAQRHRQSLPLTEAVDAWRARRG